MTFSQPAVEGSSRKTSDPCKREESSNPKVKAAGNPQQLEASEAVKCFATCVLVIYVPIVMYCGISNLVMWAYKPPSMAQAVLAQNSNLTSLINVQQAYIDAFKYKLQTSQSEASFAHDLAMLEGLTSYVAAGPLWSSLGHPKHPAPRAASASKDTSAATSSKARAVGGDRALDHQEAALHAAMQEDRAAWREERAAYLKDRAAWRAERAAWAAERDAAGNLAGPGQLVERTAAAGTRSAARKLAQLSSSTRERVTNALPQLQPQAPRRNAYLLSHLQIAAMAAEAPLKARAQKGVRDFLAALRKCQARVRISGGEAGTLAAEGTLPRPASDGVHLDNDARWLDVAVLRPDQAPLMTHILVQDVAGGKRLWASKQLLACRYSAVFAGLPRVPRLQSLAVSDAILHDNDAAALSAALTRGCCQDLQVLSLARDMLSDAGAEQLAVGLTSSHALRSLDLSGSYISLKGAQTLADALNTLPALRDVNVKSFWLGRSGREAFKTKLEHIEHLAV